jgi:hypothetical protein
MLEKPQVDASTADNPVEATTAPNQIDPDGDDDPAAVGDGTVPTAGHFERVGKPPLGLQRICDLAAHEGALYAAHANQPLGTDGATVTRYRPNDSRQPFDVAFDWNRPGQPTEGGGAGQGFLRVHRIGGRLFVPDSDPPHLGFGLSGVGTEGYVFVSDAAGEFAKARMPAYHPPRLVSSGASGVALLPGALHVFDVARFRGRYYASTGAIPKGKFPTGNLAPGALYVADDDLRRWEPAALYPKPLEPGVWRFTFMVRFKDRLYAGLESFDRRETHDYVYFAPPAGVDRVESPHARAVRVTASGAAHTLRWFADRGKLYWIAWNRDGTTLRVTDDGDEWREVPMPPDVGAPTDIVRFRDSLLVLTEWALVRLGPTEPTVISLVTEKISPFKLSDGYCAAPLAVLDNQLYAGGQRGGMLYKLAPGDEAPTK